MRLAPEVGITEAERFRLRNEAIAAMALPDLRVAKELDVPRAKENGFAVDPAFERYAFKRDDGTVVVRRLSDDAELFRLPGLPPAHDTPRPGSAPTAATWPWAPPEANPPGLGPPGAAARADRTRDGLRPIRSTGASGPTAANWPSAARTARSSSTSCRAGGCSGAGPSTPAPQEPWPTARTAPGSRSWRRTGATVQVISREAARLLATLPHPAERSPLRLEPASAERAGRGRRGRSDLHLGRGHRQADHGPQGRDLQRDHPRLSPRRRAAGQPGLAARAAAVGHPDGPAWS